MLERMWYKGNTSPLPGTKNFTTTLEISIVVSQKIGDQSTARLSNTTLGYIPKGCSTILQGHLFHYVYSSIICIIQNLETTYMRLI